MAEPEVTGDLIMPPERKKPAPPPLVLEQDSPWMQMIEVGISRNLDMDKLERLFAMQIQYEDRQREAIASGALAEFQATRPVVKQGKHVVYTNKDGTETDYWHAELMDLVQGTKEALADAGLSFTWKIDDDGNGKMTVGCVVRHKSGHVFEAVTASGPYDQSGGKNAIQARQSSITYLQKATFKAALGIAEGDPDDDGRNAGVEAGAQPAVKKEGKVDKGQMRMLMAKLDAAKDWDAKKLCEQLEIASLDDMDPNQLKKAMGLLKSA